MQDRRTVLKSLGVGAATAGFGLVGLGGARVDGGGGRQVSEPVRIGLVEPLSGQQQQVGRAATAGFHTYFGYRGADLPQEVTAEEVAFEVNGTSYVVDVRDSGGEPDAARAAADDVVGDVSAVVGGATGETATAIADVATDAAVPFLAGPVDSVGLTADSGTCSAQLFRPSETVAMESIAGARYLASRDDVASVALYHAETDTGRAIRDNYQRVLEAEGTTVADTQALPVRYDDDWPGQFQQAVDAGVDAVVGGFSIATFPRMAVSYLDGEYDFRLVGGWGTELTAGALGSILQGSLDDLTAAAIEATGLGPLTTGYHPNQYDNPVNDTAVDLYRSTFGRTPNAATAGLFTAASAVVQAVEESGSATPRDLTVALRGMTVETTLKGEAAYQFQAHDNQARSPMTVAPIVPTEDQDWDAPVQPGTPVTRVEMDEATPGTRHVECDLGPVEDAETETTEDTPDSSSDGQPETIAYGETETAEDTSGGGGTAASEDGPLGPGVGVLGIAGGLGAAWLANRRGDDSD